MPTSQARIATKSGTRTLVRLCKHWSHKFEVEHTQTHGRIAFGEGRSCELDATDDELVCTAVAATAEGLERLQKAVAEHVQRMAKEELGPITWVRND